MPSISHTIAQLNKFSDNDLVDTVVTLISELNLNDPQVDEKLENIRHTITYLFNIEFCKKNYIKREGISLTEAAYNALLALAEFKPINLDTIIPEYLVYVSTGYQFDIRNLIAHHYAREVSTSITAVIYNENDPQNPSLIREPQEMADAKWLLNPITGSRFSPRDVDYIKAFAREKNLDIKSLLTRDDLYSLGKNLIEAYPSDFLTAEHCLKEAAALEHADAAYLLSAIYYDEVVIDPELSRRDPAWLGVREDFLSAYQYLVCAADLGHQAARLVYAKFLYKGKSELNIAEDKDQALLLVDELVNENYIPAIRFNIKLLDRKLQIKKEDNDEHLNQILLLLNKAAALGDKKAHYLLAKLYFNGSVDKLKSIVIKNDVDLAMRHLQTCAKWGVAKAAMQLAAIYLHENIDEIVIDRSTINIPYNLQAAIAILETVCNLFDDNKITECAYKLAQLFRTKSESAENKEQRKEKMLHYYSRAVGHDHRHARAELGTILLMGDTELNVTANQEEANKIFATAKTRYDSHLIAQEISAKSLNSSENIATYLYWLIKSVGLAERAYELRQSVVSMLNLLIDGKFYSCTDKEITLLSQKNSELTTKWEIFSNHLPSERDNDDNQKKYIKELLASDEYKNLVRDTFQLFNLPCPFNFEPKEDDTVEFTVQDPQDLDRMVTIIASKDNVATNRTLNKLFDQRIAPLKPPVDNSVSVNDTDNSPQPGKKLTINIAENPLLANMLIGPVRGQGILASSAKGSELKPPAGVADPDEASDFADIVNSAYKL